MKATGEKRLLKLIELDEFHLHSNDNSKILKEMTKKWHDKYILDIVFKPRQLILLFNSRLKVFLSNLYSKWSGSF